MRGSSGRRAQKCSRRLVRNRAQRLARSGLMFKASHAGQRKDVRTEVFEETHAQWHTEADTG